MLYFKDNNYRTRHTKCFILTEEMKIVILWLTVGTFSINLQKVLGNIWKYYQDQDYYKSKRWLPSSLFIKLLIFQRKQ